MANVFTYNTPNRKQYHEELVPTPPTFQSTGYSSNVAFCVTDTYGYRTLAHLLRRLVITAITSELRTVNNVINALRNGVVVCFAMLLYAK